MPEERTRDLLEEMLVANTMDAPIDRLRAHLCFPTDEARDLYLDEVAQRSEAEVVDLLHRMLRGTTAQSDSLTAHQTVDLVREHLGEQARLAGSLLRLLWRERTETGDAWEGMTWVLGYLPHQPGKALSALELYLSGEPGLPDARVEAIDDAMAVIRAYFIKTPQTQAERLSALKAIDPRRFELLVGVLYEAMGFEVEMTARSNDGGFDLRARSFAPGAGQDLLIECKRYTDKKVGRPEVQRLNGVEQGGSHHAGRVLIALAGFSRLAREFAALNGRTWLVDGECLVEMLNEYLGSSWPSRIEILTVGRKRRNATLDEEPAPKR